MLSILDVSAALRPPFDFPYPGHQKGPMIEEFSHAYLKRAVEGDFRGTWSLDEPWTYLPAYWTSYECRRSQAGRFGRSLARRKMQRFLDSLPGGRRYFTLSQHDDGLSLGGRYRVSAPIFEFSAGGAGDVPIPLLCDPHRPTRRHRDLRASFVGALSTHYARYPLREAMAAALAGRNEYLVRDVAPAWGERDGRSLSRKTADFVDVLSRSVFALCPRGYGKTSFRLYEAMQLGCIPVYIYDEPWLPYADQIDWNEICVLVPPHRVGELHEMLADVSQSRIDSMRRRIAELQPEFFTYEAVMRHVPRYLNAATGRSLPSAAPAPAEGLLRRAG